MTPSGRRSSPHRPALRPSTAPPPTDSPHSDPDDGFSRVQDNAAASAPDPAARSGEKGPEPASGEGELVRAPAAFLRMRPPPARPGKLPPGPATGAPLSATRQAAACPAAIRRPCAGGVRSVRVSVLWRNPTRRYKRAHVQDTTIYGLPSPAVTLAHGTPLPAHTAGVHRSAVPRNETQPHTTDRHRHTTDA